MLSSPQTSQSPPPCRAGSRSRSPASLLCPCAARPGPWTPAALPAPPGQFLGMEKHHLSQCLRKAQLWKTQRTSSKNSQGLPFKSSSELTWFSTVNFSSVLHLAQHCELSRAVSMKRRFTFDRFFYPLVADTQKNPTKTPPNPTPQTWDMNLNSMESV